MTSISDTQAEFSARLARIEAGNRARTQRVFVGTDESYTVPRHSRVGKVRPKRRLSGLVQAPLALGLGLAAEALGVILRFHAQGLPDLQASPDQEMAIAAGLGLMLALALALLLRLRSKGMLLPGVVLGLLFLHNAVHLWPQEVAQLTSQPFVAQVMAQTKPHSLLWRGVSYPL